MRFKKIGGLTMSKAWWKEAVVYQIYPRSFMDSNGDGIGDLNGITSRLDYLKELGVDVIWLSPIYQSPNDDNGYDISNYRAIMTEFGTMEDFDRMLAGIHERGMRLVMDLVVNHTSDEHPWFVESRKSKDNPYRDYYIWRDGKDGKEPNNWGSYFSGSAWQHDDATDMYYLHLFSKKQPDLNWENPKVREEVFDMMNWWCGEKGIDGFRMDVISLISKTPGLPDGPKEPGALYGYADCANGPREHEFLKEMNQKVLSHYDLMTVGEAAGVTIEEAKRYAGFDEHELNMVFHFDHVGLDGGKLGKYSDNRVPLVPFKKIMSDWQTELEDKAWNSLYLSNHDQPRSVSRFGDDSPEYREASAKMLATCLHMMQGTPYVYQGEELGMTNIYLADISEVNDIDSVNAYHEMTGAGLVTEEDMMRYINLKGRDNARTPMQWDDSANAGFTTGTPWLKVNPNYTTINAKAELEDPDSIFHYYQKIIALRKEKPVMVYGHYELLEPDHESLYVYTRSLENQKLLVICSFTKDPVSYEIPAEFADAQILIGNYGRSEAKGTIELKPYEAIVLELNK
jgi:oligo-1,6-glucosidase